MSLKDIFCQDRVISMLQRALASDRSAHAYIFAGPDGVGRFTTAREWARMLLCKDHTTNNGFADSCGACESCRLFDAGSHPDFHHVNKELLEFTKDGKGKTTPVDVPVAVIREFLIDKVSSRPTLSAKRVFVVSEAEKLNDSSQNSLLKVLEEPPEYCCLILLCTRPDKLLPTTKSRCQILRFGPIAEQRIIEKLTETGIEAIKARYFARLALGSIGQACQWAHLELAGADLYSTKKKLVDILAACKYTEALNHAEWILSESKTIAGKWADVDEATSKTDISRRTQKTLVAIAISALHDAMILHLADTDSIINSDQKTQIKELAERFDLRQLSQKIADCYKLMRQIDSSVNERLIFEQLLLNLAVFDKIRV